MDDFASGKDPNFLEYFAESIGWFALFCVFTFLSIVMLLVSFTCVFCPKCCVTCKRDLKRSDYQK